MSTVAVQMNASLNRTGMVWERRGEEPPHLIGIAGAARRGYAGHTFRNRFIFFLFFSVPFISMCMCLRPRGLCTVLWHNGPFFRLGSTICPCSIRGPGDCCYFIIIVIFRFRRFFLFSSRFFSCSVFSVFVVVWERLETYRLLRSVSHSKNEQRRWMRPMRWRKVAKTLLVRCVHESGIV